MNVLIAGCGYVGGAVARLLARNHDVSCLRRGMAHDDAIVSSGCNGSRRDVQADLLDRHSLIEPLARPFDAVVYCAAPSARDRASYRAIYVDGLRNVLSLVAPTTRVVFTSSTSVYAERNGAWVDERSPLRRDNGAPDRLSEGAAAVPQLELIAAERLLERSQQHTTVLRLSGIYGPERTRLVDRIKAGQIGITGDLAFTNRIHRDDAAAACVHVLGLSNPAPIYNVTDSDPCTRDALVRWVRRQLCREVDDDVPTELPPSKNKRVANLRLLQSGFVLRYPSFRDGYRAWLTDNRNNPTESP